MDSPWTRWTHDPQAVARACTILFALLIGTGLLGQWSGFYDPPRLPGKDFLSLLRLDDESQAAQLVQRILSDPERPPEETIAFIHQAGTFWENRDDAPILESLNRHPLAEILVPLWNASMHPPENPQDPHFPLRRLAAHDPPTPFASFALGYWLLQADSWKPAAEAFAREAVFFNRPLSRKYELQSLFQAKDFPALEERLQLADYRPFFFPGLRFKMALQRGDWKEVARWQLLSEYKGVDGMTWALAALVACVWLILGIRMAWAPAWGAREILLYGGAFWLGAASTWLAVFWSSWSERALHWTQPEDMVGTLLFCLAGISLPEESFKLLLFLPLLPLVLKTENPVFFLMAPGFVGLGFAAEENIGYLQEGGSLAAINRFIYANFLHFSTTGIAGLALCQACQKRAGGWDGFFLSFGGVILAHGIYDAFVVSPELAEYWFVAPGCLVVLAYHFFASLSEFRGPVYQNFSLTAVFAIGLTLLSGASFHFLMPLHEPITAFRLLGTSLLSSGPLIYMFIREMHEL